MGFGASLILIAVGAILRWAVTASTTGVHLHTVGLILLIVGGTVLVLSLVVDDRLRRTPEPRGLPGRATGAHRWPSAAARLTRA